MHVALSAATALHDDDLLPVFEHLSELFAAFLTAGDGAEGHFNDSVLAVLAEAEVGGAVATVFCEDVLGIAEVQQRPQVAVAAQDDVAAFAAVAAVGTRFGVLCRTGEVRRACPAISGAAEYVDQINEVLACHLSYYYNVLV